MKTFKKVLLALGGVVLTAAIGFFTYYLCVTRDLDLDHDKLCLSTKNLRIFDGENREIQSVSSSALQNCTSIEELAPYVCDAFVSVEDKRFYSHHGLDARRIVGAALKNLKAGSFKEGASTISQQLVKNTHLTHEKTLKRKLQEFKLTRQLERRYEKERILEKYVNSIYFGHNCFGITCAAKFYFDKQPSELTVGESALLAGLVRSPNNYSPFNQPEKSKKRRDLVLKLMLEQGKISDTVYQSALAEPLPTPREENTRAADGYLRAVVKELDELAEIYGFSVSGELCVYTKFDPELQALLQTLAQKADCDKAMLVQERESALYKAYYATANLRRSPGSAIKPLLVYAPAIEEGLLCPATPILDERTDFSGYCPKNYNDVYLGYTSARTCLAKSLNVPAVKILNQTGVKKSAAYLDKMNLSVAENDYSLALALGGMQEGFTLEQLLGGYSTLANGGEYAPASFISEIRVQDRILYKKQSLPVRVFSPETAYLTTDMLKTSASEGTAKKLRSLSFPIAAKTGTVGNESGNRDAYTFAYSPRDVFGVWLGNRSNAAIPYTGGGLPCNFALSVYEYLYDYYQTREESVGEFFEPLGIKRAQIDKSEYEKNQQLVLCDDLAPDCEKLTELFTSRTLPTKKSDKYTHPAIEKPKLRYENGVLEIELNNLDCYEYLIERECQNKREVLFQGKLTKPFIDQTLEENKVYIYTITPIFNSIKGTPIQTPKLYTGTEKTPFLPDNLLEEDWWNE